MVHEAVYIIPKDGLKCFVGAIQAIGKIGKELSFGAGANGVILRTLNESHSASCEFVFTQMFFESVHVPIVYENENFKCKVFVKAFQNVFRTVKRVVEQLDVIIKIDETDQSVANLVFQLHCEQRITKTFCLGISDCQVVRAMFDKENTPNRWVFFLANRVYFNRC